MINVYFNKYFCEENVLLVKFKINKFYQNKKKSISHLVNKYNNIIYNIHANIKRLERLHIEKNIYIITIS